MRCCTSTTARRSAAKCLLIATGADYRLLDVEGCEQFEGRGVYYAATPIEAPVCRGLGRGRRRRRQLGRPGRRLPRRAGSARCTWWSAAATSTRTCPSYLARRIEQTPNIEVLLNTEVRRMRGDRCLREVEVVNSKTGEVRDDQDPRAVQLHRRGAADRVAPAGDREGREGVRPDGAGAGEIAALDGHGGSPSCWRPAAPASSPRATSGPARPSASPRPSARGRWRSCSCTNT